MECESTEPLFSKQLDTGTIMYMHTANERRRYIVTSSPIGWVHTQNDPWRRLASTSLEIPKTDIWNCLIVQQFYIHLGSGVNEPVHLYFVISSNYITNGSYDKYQINEIMAVDIIHGWCMSFNTMSYTMSHKYPVNHTISKYSLCYFQQFQNGVK